MDEVVAESKVLGRIDDEEVTPDGVLSGGHTGSAVDEITGVAREEQVALVDRVDRDVTTADVVTQGAAEAAVRAEVGHGGTSVTGGHTFEVVAADDRVHVEGEDRVAACEVDVLRHRALRADRVGRILARGSGDRDVAFEDVAHVDGDDVITGEVDVEVDRGLRPVGPHGDVGEDRGRRSVVQREKRRHTVGVGVVHLEVRQEQGSRRHRIKGAEIGFGRSAKHEETESQGKG